jgi:tetratricopeptide (TPR) repeat protein
MKTPAAADLQRWSEEVARDHASLAFLPLARAYRRQGRRDAALRLCLKGLAAHPDHVEAHTLLALLYLEAGDRARAADEWSIVLRLEAGNFDALRGLGFCCLEQNDLTRARQYLERAALSRPGDAAVTDALRMLRDRIDAAAERAGFGATLRGRPERTMPANGASGRLTKADTAAVEPTPPTLGAASGARANGAIGAVDPALLFDSFLGAGPLLGVLVLDARGLVLAGRLGRGAAADEIGAIIGGAIGDAARTVAHLELGEWGGLLLETDVALVHVAPVAERCIVLLAAKRDAPMGWVLRTAVRANELARRFLAGQP